MRGIFALLRRDIRTRPHQCWANSLVSVDAALEGIEDQSRGTPEEMRAARGLTVSCTLHHSYARAGQERAELANVPTKSTRNGCTVSLLACNDIAHPPSYSGQLIRLPGQAMSCSAFSVHENRGVRAFLHCDIRASLHDRWAQLLLCVCHAGFQDTANCVLETSLLSLPKHLSRTR